MRMTAMLVAAGIGAAAMFAAPQSASALPQVSDAKQVTTSNVEKAGYRHHRRHWRHRHYYRGHRYHRHHRHYYRRPGFGIYLGL
ncbi:hypothetical protein [Hyphomicrobium sp. NDB2Meth4]|uniref:hypothetical protein n=1 Tax=Hyphomicrobium sp. NDB2Meth4 TaxID=1892846 RepID=UPI000930D4EC|nr:hypothetical protein [Hyphomicrobium sp. NDB2Meth4]